jgi:N-acetylmuramoyl-L-alanine amidase
MRSDELDRLCSMRNSAVLGLALGILAASLGPTVGEPPNSEDLSQTDVSATPSFPPPILPREKWGAKSALPGMQKQSVMGIILHHTGVRKNPNLSIEAKMRGLQNFSQHIGKVSETKTKPVWPDVPYHYYIDAHGRIAQGRDAHFAGDTNTNYETNGYIQVVVEGDFEKEAPEPAQLTALRNLLVLLLLSWDFPPEAISVHKDHAPTDCPGSNLMAELPALRAAVAEQREQIVNDPKMAVEICAQKLAQGAPSSDCRSSKAMPKRRTPAPSPKSSRPLKSR